MTAIEIKMTKKKKPRALKAFLSFDPEDMEPEAFMWNEIRKPPPLIKPKIKKKEGQEDKPS